VIRWTPIFAATLNAIPLRSKPIFGGAASLDAMRILAHCEGYERPETDLRHSPGDYRLATHAGCGRLFSS
jgi:hypothetical protein